MSTTITATPLPDVAGVRLDVAGAPVLGSAYRQDWNTTGTGADGWTSDAGGSASQTPVLSGQGNLQVTMPTAVQNVPTRAKRTVTGLTPGTAYRLTLSLQTSNAKVAAGVEGIGSSPWVTFVNIGSSTQLVYDFTATATSHVIEGRVMFTTNVSYTLNVDDVTVATITPAGAPTTIVRVDANGSHVVRTRDQLEPIAGTMSVVDYEPALVGPIRYDLTDSAGVTVSVSTTLAGLVALPRLHPATLPQYATAVRAVTGYTAGRDAASTVHDIVDREEPVVVLGVLRTRRGRLEMWCQDYATARQLEQLAALGEVLCLRQPTHPGMDMYFTATASAVEPDVNGRWKCTLEYVEVSFPTGPLAGGAGWTFAALVAEGGTFAELPARYPTFGALAVGP